jgi:hypothetical protein
MPRLHLFTLLRRRLSLMLLLALAVLPALPAAPAAPRAAATPLIIAVPDNRVRMQRGFVSFDGTRRLAACVVGTPAGVHYAYDFDTGAVLAMWRGAFADMSDMWVGPGHDQVVRPAAPAVTLSARPLLALFPNRLFRLPAAWPGEPEPLYQSLGYELEPDGQPVFRARLENLQIRDRVAAAPGGRGLTRHLVLSGRLSPWETWLLLGEAASFQAEPGGSVWRAAPGDWRIEWPAGARLRPEVRTGSRLQLAVRLDREALTEPVVYSLTW